MSRGFLIAKPGSALRALLTDRNYLSDTTSCMHVQVLSESSYFLWKKCLTFHLWVVHFSSHLDLQLKLPKITMKVFKRKQKWKTQIILPISQDLRSLVTTETLYRPVWGTPPYWPTHSPVCHWCRALRWTPAGRSGNVSPTLRSVPPCPPSDTWPACRHTHSQSNQRITE